jgi:putative endonuclease
MNTTGLGKSAEAAVADKLEKDGYRILDRNWRRRTCEIDIVGKKGSIIYFVEVKYRTSEAQGSGLEYITDKKLTQIKHGAQLWMLENDWDGDWRILAAAVKSDQLEPIVEELVEVF